MSRQRWILLLVAVLMIAGAGAMLVRMKASQKLGAPGVKTRPLAGHQNLEVVLPETVAGYVSEWMGQDSNVVKTLPADTSYGQRRYRTADGFWSQVNVVLMGSDRTSIHKPQFCLEGNGWKIDPNASRVETVHIERPQPYDLPVMKVVSTRQVQENGQLVTLRGLYVYWFVADQAYTTDHLQRMWWMAEELLLTGVLQRWAYISYFSVCLPGQEEQTFERMKKLMVASVPEFQLVPAPAAQTVAQGAVP
jgi:hypothetical protein